MVAQALCHADHARYLDATVATSSRQSITTALRRWRVGLRRELSDDPHGLIGRHIPHVASHITESFPPASALLQYARPLTSEITPAGYPNPGDWSVRMPNTATLCTLFCELFNCQGNYAIQMCKKLIWGGLCIRQLAQVCVPTLVQLRLLTVYNHCRPRPLEPPP